MQVYQSGFDAKRAIILYMEVIQSVLPVPLLFGYLTALLGMTISNMRQKGKDLLCTQEHNIRIYVQHAQLIHNI